AALGTLPDLDSLPLALLTDDPVALMTLHRGASHSLLVLPLVGWLAWAWLRGRGGRVAQAPRRWFWAIQLALVTHPLLDAFTVYGTQLLWPLPLHPVMWASVFIIDPLYTLWLLLACVAAFVLRERVAALDALRGAPAVERLAWFNRGFMRAREVGGELVLSDLRMGHEPDYVFNFAVARRGA